MWKNQKGVPEISRDSGRLIICPSRQLTASCIPLEKQTKENHRFKSREKKGEGQSNLNPCITIDVWEVVRRHCRLWAGKIATTELYPRGWDDLSISDFLFLISLLVLFIYFIIYFVLSYSIICFDPLTFMMDVFRLEGPLRV